MQKTNRTYTNCTETTPGGPVIARPLRTVYVCFEKEKAPAEVVQALSNCCFVALNPGTLCSTQVKAMEILVDAELTMASIQTALGKCFSDVQTVTGEVRVYRVAVHAGEVNNATRLLNKIAYKVYPLERVSHGEAFFNIVTPASCTAAQISSCLNGGNIETSCIEPVSWTTPGTCQTTGTIPLGTPVNEMTQAPFLTGPGPWNLTNPTPWTTGPTMGYMPVAASPIYNLINDLMCGGPVAQSLCSMGISPAGVCNRLTEWNLRWGNTPGPLTLTAGWTGITPRPETLFGWGWNTPQATGNWMRGWMNNPGPGTPNETWGMPTDPFGRNTGVAGNPGTGYMGPGTANTTTSCEPGNPTTGTN